MNINNNDSCFGENDKYEAERFLKKLMKTRIKKE